jgi:hypothetical protein
MTSAAKRAANRALASSLAGEGASPALQAEAAVVAEAQVDLQRARTARADRHAQFAAALARESRRISQAIALDDPPLITPGMIKMAIQALAALIKDLARLDRYERRALSRRRTAVQRLDDLRAAEARSDI